ncbi:hypothetical protein [Candidatus Phytoplasma ziziphi]|nr:hypothetical protein [Candidatus Phytoplasma ziziphi]
MKHKKSTKTIDPNVFVKILPLMYLLETIFIRIDKADNIDARMICLKIDS